MVKTYSRRLLSPYSGQVQIAETVEARALSLDGKHWEMQYQIVAKKPPPGLQKGSEQMYQYVRIAAIRDSRVVQHPLHPMLDAGKVATVITQLASAVMDSEKPFLAVDVFEYWLLDASDGQPLALIADSITETEMATSRVKPKWAAMPAAQLAIQDSIATGNNYVVPINYRLQKCIEERAGKHPRGKWFKRHIDETESFPPCLIREDWEDQEEKRLCQSYIQRMAPRLLMLQGLPDAVREELEMAAKQHALEVEQYYPLYPQVINQKLINTLLVEARMRRAAKQG